MRGTAKPSNPSPDNRTDAWAVAGSPPRGRCVAVDGGDEARKAGRLARRELRGRYFLRDRKAAIASLAAGEPKSRALS